MDNKVTESREAMEALLRAMPFGFLGLAVDNTPYVIPLNYAYVDGKLLFHCALEGKKLEYLATNPTVCFTVARQMGAVDDHTKDATCHIDSESVVCYGTARIIADLEERATVLNTFNRHFRPDGPEIAKERAAGCAVIEVTVTEMTGLRKRDGDFIRWQYRFGE